MIDTVAEISGRPEDNVIMSQRPELAELAQLTRESNGDPGEPHTLIRLGKAQRVGPIKNSRGLAFQSYRYTTFDSLRTAQFTHELQFI